MLQKIDKELETALATLEKEKEEALKDLDAQVLADAWQCLPLSHHEHKLIVCRLESFLERSWPVCFPRVSSFKSCLTLLDCEVIEEKTCGLRGAVLTCWLLLVDYISLGLSLEIAVCLCWCAVFRSSCHAHSLSIRAVFAEML